MECAVISLTENAVQAVRAAIARAAEPMTGLRIMVEAGGCAGLQYRMGLVDVAEAADLEIEQGGVKVFVDPVSVGLLDGTVIDFVERVEGAGFVFDNPQASDRCSCGKSFN